MLWRIKKLDSTFVNGSNWTSPTKILTTALISAGYCLAIARELVQAQTANRQRGCHVDMLLHRRAAIITLNCRCCTRSCACGDPVRSGSNTAVVPLPRLSTLFPFSLQYNIWRHPRHYGFHTVLRGYTWLEFSVEVCAAESSPPASLFVTTVRTPQSFRVRLQWYEGGIAFTTYNGQLAYSWI